MPRKPYRPPPPVIRLAERPPFDAALGDAILKLLRLTDVTPECAAESAGCDRAVFEAWRLAAAQDATAGITSDYTRFVAALVRARCECLTTVRMAVHHAAQAGDYRAAQAMSRVLDPARYTERNAVEVTGAGGGPVEVIGVMEAERRKEAKARGEGGG